MALGVGTAATEIRVGQQADHGICFVFLVKVCDVPFTLVFGRTILSTKQVAGVVLISFRVLCVIAKQGEIADFPLGEYFPVTVVVQVFKLAGDRIVDGRIALEVIRFFAENRSSAGDIKDGVTTTNFQFAEVTCLEVESSLEAPREFCTIFAVAFEPGSQALGENDRYPRRHPGLPASSRRPTSGPSWPDGSGSLRIYHPSHGCL